MTTQERKTALITGSYGELGTQFVNIHASRGGDLILVGRNAKKLADQQKEARRKYNVTAHIIDVDLSQPDAAQKIYDTCKKNGWTIDYLINNAGFAGQGEFIKRSMEQDMSMIAVNIETPTRLTKLFLPDFVCLAHFKPFTTLLKHTLQAGQMRYGVKYKAQALR